MTLDIPCVRPALFDRETVLILDELRAFRHIFRHLYAQPLDREKALLVQRKVGPSIAAFRDADVLYRRLLSEIAEGLR